MDLLTRLQTERTSLVEQATKLAAGAAEAQRSLTDAEEQIVRDLTRDIDALTAKIEPLEGLARREEANAETQRLLTGIEHGQLVRTDDDTESFLRSFTSPGEFIATRAIAKQAGDLDTLAKFDRALSHEKLAAVPGLLPQNIVGPMIDWLERSRPVINSFTRRPLPSVGSQFDRPRVTKRTAAGLQSGEKEEFVSGTYEVETLTVTKKTVGTTLNFSRQVIDWTDPSILNMAINDMVTQVGLESESLVTAEVVTQAAKQKQPLDMATAKAADVLAALAAASTTVYAGTTRLADRLIVSSDVWAALMAVTAEDGRPVLNYGYSGGDNNIGSSSGLGSWSFSLAGWSGVVAPKAPAGTFIIADSQSVEVYEDPTQLLRVDEPSIAGLLVGVFTYLAFQTIESKGLVALGKTTK